MLTITLPTEKRVREAIGERIAQLSFQLDVAGTTQEVMRRWIGKRINKRVADQLNEAIKPIAKARSAHIFATVKKRDWPIGQLNYDLTWYQSGPFSETVKLEMPTSVFPGELTEEAIANLYQHSVHITAMRRHLADLIAYRDHPTWIAHAVRDYTAAINAWAAVAAKAGPMESLCEPDGTPRTDMATASVLYPIRQLFPEPYISHVRD